MAYLQEHHHHLAILQKQRCICMKVTIPWNFKDGVAKERDIGHLVGIVMKYGIMGSA